MIRTGHIRKSEFTEEDFISGLETALSKACYSPWPLEISRVSQDAEHELGYDGFLNSLVPFYIQFKSADFCLPQFEGTSKQDRVTLGLPCQKGFFRFKLHKDKTTKKYDQHNALFKLACTERAAYIAPTFYRKPQLTAFKQMAITAPWSYHDYMIYDFPLHRDIPTRSSRAFAHCMTIQPHREITDTEPSHYYSYVESGFVAFHSDPERVEKGVQPLSRFLGYVGEAVFEGRNQSIPVRDRLLKLLPKLYGLTWESKGFLAIVRSTLIDLDLFPHTRSTNIQKWVFEVLGLNHILLLVESMLLEDFNIIQYVAKPM